ncbi:MBL fold metallo-hydrolase [Jannaschia aquimarina]|uniref:Blh_1 protein n=1 Tax=Jannaschia aquimarina TaxID=935700 RepID=A0A0D1EKJ6_9RHOB|nr:MBL fold metallo-hydrolase [Jannaschia aquimarina]KIT18119.1 Beta-lactamase hydrolase-like protein [Jannaschia aquimarina]SNT41061.1 Glyoxylase, beta-lactamase superfamily II [Jannaschia aquimarina]
MTEPLIRHSPSRGPSSPDVWGVYDEPTGSVQYVAACPVTRKAALIDVVLGFDPRSFATNTRSMDAVLDLVGHEKLVVEHILDTHPHADHLMASARLREATGAPNAIGAKVREIAALWRDLYHLPDAFDPNRDFDRLLADGDTFSIGDLPVRVMLSPGHTLGSISFVVGEDVAFVHDTLMYPDMGTSRCDFPGGSAAELWDSVQAILALPGPTRLFVGHDYGAEGREDPMWEATVADHLDRNKHVHAGADRDAWIAKREERDATLALPDRMLAALQVNLRAGRLPEAEADGHRYLKMPLNRF